MRNKGIWIDKKNAHIISCINNIETVDTIISEIEDFKTNNNVQKSGAKDVVKDRKNLEREKHYLKAFFKNINSKIEDADNIVIFGPAQTGEKFITELRHINPGILPRIRSTKKADSMTENQMKSWVREFFNNL